MAHTMLEYAKEILTKVSFDVKLFEKELLKSIKYLATEEVKALKTWCFKTFGDRTFRRVLQRAFRLAFQQAKPAVVNP